MSATCTCGETHPHVIVRRRTADDVGVNLWSDGAITGALGRGLDGVPITRPRSEPACSLVLQAAHLFMGEVELIEADELGELFRASTAVAKRCGRPGDVRAAFHLVAEASPTLRPNWDVYETDRDGRPKLRVWKLPRMRWPGLAVWDHTHQGRGGRYELHTYDRSGVAMTTGIRFSRLDALSKHLLAEERGRRS